MNKIDIIIPLHKFDDSMADLFGRCYATADDMIRNTAPEDFDARIVLVGPEKVMDDAVHYLQEKNYNAIKTLNNDKETDFCTQVNEAVKESDADFFMVVEYDDVVNVKWLSMAKPYLEKRTKTSVFLPLIEAIDYTNKTEPFYINEIAWSNSFADDELGSLNLEHLKTFCNFNVTGAIIRRNEFVKAGGLKPSIKLSFNYELLLRMANLYGDVFVIPKVGYFHSVNVPGSLTTEYHKTMEKEEGSWWIELALQEYHFKKDRKKTYEKSPEE